MGAPSFSSHYILDTIGAGYLMKKWRDDCFFLHNAKVKWSNLDSIYLSQDADYILMKHFVAIFDNLTKIAPGTINFYTLTFFFTTYQDV